MRCYQSWGRFPRVYPAAVRPLFWRMEIPPLSQESYPVLPYGQGRSYGDSCLNEGGILLDTAGLNRFISFDQTQGILRCEAGVTLAEILSLIVPRGWFLPVTPGTKYVSVGGAIANDIHGKNHHRAGTFGCHVRRFELVRSSGERLLCSPDSHAELFRATIGGLGLTGLITWAEFRLKPIPSPFITMQSIRFADLEEFFELSAASDEAFEYTVAWVDGLASGRSLGRGIFLRGNHTAPAQHPLPPVPRSRVHTFPCDAPGFLLNKWSIKTFNTLYYHRQREKEVQRIVYYDPFFYPLDALQQWNRLYGKRGFLQYQCVVPFAERQSIRQLLERIAASGQASFLAVLKVFGSHPSPGMLSFPRPGVTLALDFAFQGQKTLQLLDELDAIVAASQGAVYPAKDARMSAQSFQAYFPQWQAFAAYKDPRFSSSFWRRVTQSR
ncbi:MAG: FAD-binding oxidoreductase [Nitrospinota bacterium]|nr:MAG: FAD-binding oxidoreductase [Nitrospinota bacterium]